MGIKTKSPILIFKYSGQSRIKPILKNYKAMMVQLQFEIKLEPLLLPSAARTAAAPTPLF